MEMAEEMVLRFADEQINGPYRYPAFKHAVGLCGDRVGDLQRVKRWESIATGTRKVDPTSPTSLCYQDAADCVLRLGNAFLQLEWSGADPMTWMLLRKAVVGCNRLCTMPDFLLDDGVNVKDGVLLTAFVLDCMGRVSDEDERAAFIADLKAGVNDEFVLRRGLPIYIDIVCGRGAAWLSYIDDMGDFAMKGRAGSWWQLRDNLAQAASDEYTRQSALILGVTEDEARRFVLGQLSLLGGYYDRWQFGMRKSVVGASGDANTFADETLFAKCRRDDNDTFVKDRAMDMFGYCRMFGMSAPACAFEVPRKFEVELRKERIKKVAAARKAAQNKARAKFRLPRM